MHSYLLCYGKKVGVLFGKGLLLSKGLYQLWGEKHNNFFITLASYGDRLKLVLHDVANDFGLLQMSL